MAFRYSISSIKKGKKRFFGQDTMHFELSISDLKHLRSDLFFSKKASVDRNLVVSSDIYNYRLSQLDEIRIGIKDGSFTGVYLSHKNQQFNITMFTPANEYDWVIFLKVLYLLTAGTENQIFDKDGNQIDLNDLKDHVQEEMIYAHSQVLNQTLGTDMMINLNGINGVVSLNSDLLKKYQDYEAFKTFLFETQWGESFIATPLVFSVKNKFLFTGYTLTSDLLTTLPHTPLIDDNTEKPHEKHIYFIQFFDDDKKVALGRFDYHEFIKSLNDEEFSFVDANNIQVQLSRARMLSLNNTLEAFELESYSKQL